MDYSTIVSGGVGSCIAYPLSVMPAYVVVSRMLNRSSFSI